MRQQAGRFWQARAPRERQLIVVMAVAVALLLVWLTLCSRRCASCARRRSSSTSSTCSCSRCSSPPARAGPARASPVPPEQASKALRAATEQLGTGAKLSVQGDRAVLSFNAIQATPCAAGSARRARGARPAGGGQLVKAAGGYTGSISLTLAGAS